MQDLLTAKNTILPFTSEEDESLNIKDLSLEKLKRKNKNKLERKIAESKIKNKYKLEDAYNLPTTNYSSTLSGSTNSITDEDVTTIKIKTKSKTKEVEVQTDVTLSDLLPWNSPTSVIYSAKSTITCPSTSDKYNQGNLKTQLNQKNKFLFEENIVSSQYLKKGQSDNSIQRKNKFLAIIRFLSYALKSELLGWSIYSLILSDSIVNVTLETHQLLNVLHMISNRRKNI